MARSLTYSWPVLLLCLSASLPSAFAGGTDERQHLISVGAGIASPSVTTALTENPAGLAAIRTFKLLALATDATSSAEVTTYGGGLFAGNGTLGGGAELDATRSPSSSYLTVGLGGEISSIHTAFGLSCGTGTGSGVTFKCSDFGLLYNPNGSVRFGANLLTSSSTAVIGAGVAAEASKDVTLVLDAASDTSGHGLMIKPAIALAVSDFQLTVGDGLSLDDHAPVRINQDFAAGLGWNAGRSVHLQAYYNQLAKYYLGLSVAL